MRLTADEGQLGQDVPVLAYELTGSQFSVSGLIPANSEAPEN